MYLSTELVSLTCVWLREELSSISHPTWLRAIAWAWFVKHLPFVKCQILLSSSTSFCAPWVPRSRCANWIPFRNKSFVQKPIVRSLPLSYSKGNMKWASKLISKTKIPILIKVPVVLTTERSQRPFLLGTSRLGVNFEKITWQATSIWTH